VPPKKEVQQQILPQTDVEEYEVTVGNLKTNETTLKVRIPSDQLKNFMAAIHPFLPVQQAKVH